MHGQLSQQCNVEKEGIVADHWVGILVNSCPPKRARSCSISWNTLDMGCESGRWSSRHARTWRARSASARKARLDQTCKGSPLRKVSVCGSASSRASSRKRDLLKALLDAHVYWAEIRSWASIDIIWTGIGSGEAEMAACLRFTRRASHFPSLLALRSLSGK